MATLEERIARLEATADRLEAALTEERLTGEKQGAQADRLQRSVIRLWSALDGGE